jgi:hypothetical protein
MIVFLVRRSFCIPPSPLPNLGDTFEMFVFDEENCGAFLMHFGSMIRYSLLLLRFGDLGHRRINN